MLAFLLGHWEIAIILLLALLLFGTRLPKVARSLGQGVSEFKGGLKGVQDQMNEAGDPKDGDPKDRDAKDAED